MGKRSAEMIKDVSVEERKVKKVKKLAKPGVSEEGPVMKVMRLDVQEKTEDLSADHDENRETHLKSKVPRMKTFEKTGKKSSIPKKPDWMKFKEKKKELKVERKKKKSLFEVGVKSKQLWEQLRRKSVAKDQKMALVKELHELLKGNYAKAVLSHDVGRVVQWLLKTGSSETRDEIATELKDHLVDMLQSKYGSFCMKQLLKRGSKETKSKIINACMGSVVKLMSHRIASPIISQIYSMHANSLQKSHLRQEFYGEIYRVMKNDQVKDLKSALEASHDMADSVLNSTKINLLKVINKDLVESQLVNCVLGDFLALCKEADRSEVVTAINSFLPLLSQTKEGSRVGMMCLWHGTQKDRKLIIKSLKGSVSQVAVCEHGYLVLLSLFDNVDDTVLVKKAIISEIVNSILDIAKDKCGRKVILHLVSPRDPSYFHPDVVEILKAGDGNSHSKKPSELRRAELLSAVSEPFLDSITNKVSEWFSNNSIGMVALAILKSCEGPKLRNAFEALAAHVCTASSLKKDEEANPSIVEDPGLHFVLKKLILYDQVRHGKDAEGVLFSEVLVSSLDETSLQQLISSNRGCFILVALLEIKIPRVVDELKNKVKKKIFSKLKKLDSQGSKVLREKLED